MVILPITSKFLSRQLGMMIKGRVATVLLANFIAGASGLALEKKEIFDVTTASYGADLEQVSTLASRGMAFAGELQSAFPGYFLVAHCTGSFLKNEALDVAAVLVNPDRSSLKLVVSTISSGDNAAIIEIAQARALAERGKLLMDIEIQCLSSQEASQMNLLLSEVQSISGELHPRSMLDLVCLMPSPAADHRAAACYSFDIQKAKFFDVGGWVN